MSIDSYLRAALVLSCSFVASQAFAQGSAASAPARVPGSAAAPSSATAPTASAAAGVDALKALIEADRRRRDPAGAGAAIPRAALALPQSPLPPTLIPMESEAARPGEVGSREPRLVAIWGRPGREVAVLKWKDVEHRLTRSGQVLGDSGWSLSEVSAIAGQVRLNRPAADAKKSPGRDQTLLLSFSGAMTGTELASAGAHAGQESR